MATSFRRITDPNTQVIILGTMPGGESLRKRQYYANRQNQFWKLMGALFDAGSGLRYPERLRKLRAAGIGLWDVLRHCDRETSLDADIKRPEPNNFRRLFRACPRIHTIFFNGTKAESLYRKLVLPGLPEEWSSIRYVGLPSTSPANTSMSFKEKKRRWMAVRRAVLER